MGGCVDNIELYEFIWSVVGVGGQNSRLEPCWFLDCSLGTQERFVLKLSEIEIQVFVKVL